MCNMSKLHSGRLWYADSAPDRSVGTSLMRNVRNLLTVETIPLRTAGHSWRFIPACVGQVRVICEWTALVFYRSVAKFCIEYTTARQNISHERGGFDVRINWSGMIAA